MLFFFSSSSIKIDIENFLAQIRGFSAATTAVWCFFTVSAFRQIEAEIVE